MIRVLYVDDEQDLLELGKTFLERSKELSLDIVTSVDIARTKMESAEYDAVISDYQMPETSGIDFLKDLRSRGNKIPFILFTGRGREEVVIEALNSGADFYLQKGGDTRSQFLELEHKVKEAVRRYRAENALHENEERLKEAQMIGLTGCWELRFLSAGAELWGSEEAFRIFGIERASDGIVDLEVLRSCIIDGDQAFEGVQEVIGKGLQYDREFEIHPADGASRKIIRSVGKLINDPEGFPLKLEGIVQDITERKGIALSLQRLNRELLAIKECNRALVKAQTEQELLDAICRIFCEVAGYRLVWIGYALDDTVKSVRPMAWSGYNEQYVIGVRATWGDDDRGQGPTGLAIKNGRTSFIQNWSSGSGIGPWKEAARKNGYMSSIAIPLMLEGMAMGALMLYSDQENGFSPEEIALLEEMAGDLTYGIANLRVQEGKRKAEAEMDLNRQRFESLYNAYLEGVAIHEVIFDDGHNAVDYRIIDVNPAYEKLIGISRETAKGQLASVLYGTPAFLSVYSNVAMTGIPTKFDAFFPPMNRLFSVSVFSPVQGQFACVFMDITEQKRAEAELKASEEKYRGYVDHALEGIFIADAGGRYLEVNQAACVLLGYPTEELLQLDIKDNISQGQMEMAAAKLKELKKAGHISFKIRLKKKDGSEVPVYMNAVRLPNGNLMAFVMDISDIEQVENSLRESERKYHTLFQENHAVMLIIDPTNGEIVDANPAACNYYGYPYAELLRMRIWDINTQSTGEINDEMSKAMSGQKRHFEFKHRLASGEDRDVDVYSGSIYLNGRELLFSIVHDVTDRIKQLKESEAKFQMIFNSTNEEIIIIDMQGWILEVNQVACSRLGYSKAELLSMGISQIEVPEFAGMERERIARTSEKGQLLFESMKITKDGRRIPIEISTRAIQYGGREAVLSVARDITERKQAEKALLDSERRYRQVVEGAAEAIIIVQDQKLRLVNRKASQLTGYSAEELYSHPYETIIHPEDRKLMIERHFGRLKGLDLPNYYTFRMLTKEGAVKWISISSIAIDWEDKPATLNFLTDVTEIKNAESALRNANNQLNLLNSITRHDMLNQLTVLSGYSSLLEKEGLHDKEMGLLKRMQRSIAALQAQVEFTRQYQEIGLKSPEWQVLHHLVEATMHELALGDLVIREENTEVSILADPMLERVVRNLVDNVLRHSGGATVLTIKVVKGDEGLVISFEDNGCGITKEDKAHLFERGYGKNTGFGLYLSREILKITNMTIKETSTDGKGARFEIDVPAGMFRDNIKEGGL